MYARERVGRVFNFFSKRVVPSIRIILYIAWIACFCFIIWRIHQSEVAAAYRHGQYDQSQYFYKLYGRVNPVVVSKPKPHKVHKTHTPVDTVKDSVDD